MSIYSLTPDLSATFTDAPEFAMGLQIARFATDQFSSGHLLAIIDTRIAIAFDAEAYNQVQSAQDYGLWNFPGDSGDADRFAGWLSQLPPAPPIELIDPSALRAAWPFTFFGAAGPLPSPPFPRGGVYGHLPFAASSGSDDVYYRYEAFPSSMRLDQTTRSVAPSTYASPASELLFMPTGLSVVARCALPGLLPACWRWEIQPQPNTVIRWGASVPLYGQSGGGVEVMFPQGSKNRGPIANPVLLPIL